VVVGIDGTYALAMGPLLADASPLVGLELTRHPHGLLLDYGAELVGHVEGGREANERERQVPRFGSPMARDHERWLASMGVTSIGTFNEFCVSGRMRHLTRVAEGFHEKHIGRIADAIAARGEGVRVIAIAGPSSSGKTTFIKRLTVQLEVNGVHPVGLSLDDYYVDRERCPWTRRAATTSKLSKRSTPRSSRSTCRAS
jgi:uridine kinase